MINGKKEIKKRITAIAFYQKPVVWMAVFAVVFATLLSACTAGTDKQDAMEEINGQGTIKKETSEQETTGQETAEPESAAEQLNNAEEPQPTSPQLASDVVMNPDGSFRLSEYQVALTGDKVKDRIVFDVFHWTELAAEEETITNQMLWDALWKGSEICVKIVEGKEPNHNEEEKILQEYSFSSAHVGNGNLAIVRQGGSDPLTVLPKDAEERILAGEILYMEVAKDHTTAGRLDLDGDGEKEVLYLEALGEFMNDDGWGSWNQIDSDYRVRVNDKYYENYGDNVDPILMAFSPDGRQILLAIYDDGPSGDPETVFFRYDGNGVYPAGSMPADLRLATIDEDRVIKSTFRADKIQTEWAWGYYIWNSSEIIRREDDIYYFRDDSQWREEYEVPLILKKKITVYAERSEDSRAITMKPQKVRNVATDDKEWILLEAEDGTRGWIRVVQFYFPSEDCRYDELFDGVNMAG